MFSNRGAVNPVALAAEIVEVTGPVRYTTTPPRAGLHMIGTPVHGPHGAGTIVGYNTSTSMFYGADRYPYVCKFEDGFIEVYEGSELTINPPQAVGA
jgi:hypothetical protein